MCGHLPGQGGAGFTKEAEGVCLGLAPWTSSFRTSSGSASDLFQDTHARGWGRTSSARGAAQRSWPPAAIPKWASPFTCQDHNTPMKTAVLSEVCFATQVLGEDVP